MSAAPPTQHNVVQAVRNLRVVDIEVATRATLAGGIPLVLLYVTGHMELASYAAFGALTAIYGRNEPYRLRFRTLLIAGTMLTLAITAGLTLAVFSAPTWLIALVTLFAIAGGIFTAQVAQLVPPTSMFPVMAVLIVAQTHTPAGEWGIRFVTTVAAVAFAIALTMSGWLLRKIFHSQADRFYFKPLAREPKLQWQLLKNREIWGIIALNCAGLLLAGGLALALNIGHAYWAVLAVIAVVPPPFMRLSLRRGVHRMVGTVAGVGLMAIVFAFHPEPWALILLWAVCQFVTEILIGPHYGLALLFITPRVLAISELATPSPTDVVLPHRVVATLIGAAVTMLLLWVVARRRYS